MVADSITLLTAERSDQYTARRGETAFPLAEMARKKRSGAKPMEEVCPEPRRQSIAVANLLAGWSLAQSTAPAIARRLSRHNVDEQQSRLAATGATDDEQESRPSSASDATTASSSSDNIHSVLGVSHSFISMLEAAEIRDDERRSRGSRDASPARSPSQKIKRGQVPTTHDRNPQQRRQFVLDYSRNHSASPLI